MGLLSNRVAKESLKPGDHIYSWRTAYIYAHHGIYIGDNKVIHFTRRGREVETGTVLDLLLVSSGSARFPEPCRTCTPREEGSGVVVSCLKCFLAGGVLYRFKYAVSVAHFLAKARGGTCTLAASDPSDLVVHRAKYLLKNGFGCYNVFKNNCEDFAIYCKTGLLVVDQATIGHSGQTITVLDQGTIGHSGQTITIRGGILAVLLSTPLKLVKFNVYVMVATAVVVYCACRYRADVGIRGDVMRVSLENLTTGLATGFLQVIEPQISATPPMQESSHIAAAQ